jgi:hypothetical protein
MFEYRKWTQAINPDEWLDAIKADIKNKYNIEKPKFCFDGIFLSAMEFEEWGKKYVRPPFFWVKYKHIENDAFELKPFSPWPPDEISMKIIDNFLNSLAKDKQAKYFCINKYYYLFNNETSESDYIDKPGETYYTMPEASVELRSLLRRGYSKIELVKESLIEDVQEKAYHMHVGQDSIENMIKSGFLELEYK